MNNICFLYLDCCISEIVLRLKQPAISIKSTNTVSLSSFRYCYQSNCTRILMSQLIECIASNPALALPHTRGKLKEQTVVIPQTIEVDLIYIQKYYTADKIWCSRPYLYSCWPTILGILSGRPCMTNAMNISNIDSPFKIIPIRTVAGAPCFLPPSCPDTHIRLDGFLCWWIIERVIWIESDSQPPLFPTMVPLATTSCSIAIGMATNWFIMLIGPSWIDEPWEDCANLNKPNYCLLKVNDFEPNSNSKEHVCNPTCSQKTMQKDNGVKPSRIHKPWLYNPTWRQERLTIGLEDNWDRKRASFDEHQDHHPCLWSTLRFLGFTCLTTKFLLPTGSTR